MLYKYKSRLFNRLKPALVCLLILGMLSCSKDKQLDADILSVSSSGNSISYMEAGDLVRLNGNSYNFTNIFIGVPINLSDPSKSTDTITATVDPSLVAVYNAAHLENNPSFPEGSFSTSNEGKFPVAAKASSTSDALHVTLINGTPLKNKTVYLVPVRLTAKNGAKLRYSIFYFKVLYNSSDLKAVINGITVFKGYTSYRMTGGAFNPVYVGTIPDSLKFGVALTSKFPAHETQVEGMVLSDIRTDSVNIAQRFGSIPFPAGTHNMTKSVVKIPPTSNLSTDSIIVRFPKGVGLKSFQYYLLCLKLKHYKQSEYGVPPVASDSSSVFLRFFLF